MSAPKIIKLMENISATMEKKSSSLDTYTKEEINTLLLSHNHDDMYVSLDQIDLIMDMFTDNDYGPLFEEEAIAKNKR